MWTLNAFGKLKGLAPLVLRAMLGVSFFLFHGLDKVRPGGTWDWGAAWVRDTQGFPKPLLYAAAWTELLCGFAVLVGLLTRWASLGLLAVMLTAIFVVHAADPYKVKALAIAYAAALVVLLGHGPGELSLDRVFFGKKATEP